MNNIYEKTIPMSSSEIARTKENSDIEMLLGILGMVIFLGILIVVNINLIPELYHGWGMWVALIIVNAFVLIFLLLCVLLLMGGIQASMSSDKSILIGKVIDKLEKKVIRTHKRHRSGKRSSVTTTSTNYEYFLVIGNRQIIASKEEYDKIEVGDFVELHIAKAYDKQLSLKKIIFGELEDETQNFILREIKEDKEKKAEIEAKVPINIEDIPYETILPLEDIELRYIKRKSIFFILRGIMSVLFTGAMVTVIIFVITLVGFLSSKHFIDNAVTYGIGVATLLLLWVIYVFFTKYLIDLRQSEKVCYKCKIENKSHIQENGNDEYFFNIKGVRKKVNSSVYELFLNNENILWVETPKAEVLLKIQSLDNPEKEFVALEKGKKLKPSQK